MNKNYIDITEEMLRLATPYSHDVKELVYFIDKNGFKHLVDGKNVVLDYSPKEKYMANFIAKVLGGEIFLLPRVNNPDGIQTADYLWNGEFWDLKTINGSGKRVIEDSIKNKSKQANNFIFDVSNSIIDINLLLKQVQKIYSSVSTSFVNKIVVVKNNIIICIYKRK